MDHNTAKRVAAWIQKNRPATVDITGGAPELNESFRFLVQASQSLGAQVIDRNNLTIIEEPGFDWLPEFLAAHEVEVIASLPCYSKENVNRQRGNGVFEKSICALRKLNAVGYGTRLALHLVYNPLGPKLPGPQAELEADYKEVLREQFGVVFNKLFTLTNQPIARFAEDLHKQGKWEEYMELLVNSFNPATVDNLMCRTTLSVGYRGELYDCDFNQMLGLPLRLNGKPRVHLRQLANKNLDGNPIIVKDHCYGCTAGQGSSCGGALKEAAE
jgi:radical SAM/Cys-rich protein